jgi:hypothetical protein
MLVVGTHAVAVGVGVGEYAALQHTVRRQPNTRTMLLGPNVALLDFGEVVERVAVELQHADSISGKSFCDQVLVTSNGFS